MPRPYRSTTAERSRATATSRLPVASHSCWCRNKGQTTFFRGAENWGLSLFERLVEKRQRDVHPVVDVGVVVVELIVRVRDACLVQAFGQHARAVVDVELVARPAVDVDAA